MLDIEQARKICTESKIVKLCNNNGELTFSGHLFIEKALAGWPEALDEIERLQTENKRTEEKYNLVNKLLFGNMTVSFAAIDAIKERQRQVEQEKFSANHDDEFNNNNQLAKAAAVYALPQNARTEIVKCIDNISGKPEIKMMVEILWPWDEKWFKRSPDNRRLELIKAAALIIAEIERLDRKESGNNARL